MLALPFMEGRTLSGAAFAAEAPLAAAPSQGKEKPALDAAQAKDLLAVLNDPAQRDKLVATLKSLQKIQTASQIEEPHSVLESGLAAGKDLFQKMSDAVRVFIKSIANFKALWPWLLQVWNDPALQGEIFRICVRVALVGLGGWGLSFLLTYLFRGVRQKIQHKAKDLAARAEEAQANLEFAKKETEDAQAEVHHFEKLIELRKEEIAVAAKDHAVKKEAHLAQTNQTPEEALAQAENLAARQALEEVENQAIAAQALALSDSPVVKEPIHKAAEELKSEAQAARKERISKTEKAVLEIAAKIEKLEEGLKKLEAKLQRAKEILQKAQQNYSAVRQQNQRDNLFSRWRRAPYAVAGFILDLFGIAMFPFLALLIQLLDPTPDARTMAAVWSVTWFANVVQTLWVAVLRVLFNPSDGWLRLAAISDQAAKFLFRSLRRISGFVAWSLTIIIILQACTLPGSVSAAIGKLVGLTANLMLAYMIIGARPYVTRSCLTIAARKPRFATLVHLTRQTWWIIALFFDFALWWVWAMSMRNGYQFIFWIFIKTCLALALMRFLWGILKYFLNYGDSWIRREDNLSEAMQERFLHYYPALEKTVIIILLVLTFLALAVAWGMPAGNLFASDSLGVHILSSGGTILFSLAVGVFIWEGANVFFDRQSKKLEMVDLGQKQRAARIRTLQPLFKILLLSVLIATIGMTILSELGINIAPLLASASILGVAIGFGSQKLVHDFISGVFLLLENALSVGDKVVLNSISGTVEKLSLRTVHVRATNGGSLNIFPFSSLNQITNFSRGFCSVMIGADVSYDTKVGDVEKIFFEITENLKKDPKFGDYIIGDLNFWGLDHFNDSSLAIRGSLPVTPAGRWPVTYEFNRQVHEEFEKRGINIPFPIRTLDFPPLMNEFMKAGKEKFQNPEAS